MELKGYRVPKKVKLVKTCPGYYKNEFKDLSFVVDGDNDSQLETAINWAAGYYNDDKKELVKENIIETDNEDFEVEFLYSAGGSSQGGKLSFWNCKITKDGQEYIVGINQDLLLELIKSTTIINGKVQEKCLFIKQRGNTGIVSKESEIYKKCIEELKERERISNLKQTTVWEKGYFYNSLTQSSVYITDLYLWYREEQIEQWKSRIEVLSNPIKVKYVLDSYYFNNRTKLSELFEDKSYIGNIIHSYKKTLPSRFKSDRTIEIDLTSNQLEQIRLDHFKEYNSYYRENRIKLALTTFTDRFPKLPEDMKNKTSFEI